MQVARCVFVGRRAANQRQEIRRERQESFQREAPRDILDMRVEAAVFVNGNNGRTLALGRRANEVAVDLAMGRIVGDALRRQAPVIGGDGRGDTMADGAGCRILNTVGAFTCG